MSPYNNFCFLLQSWICFHHHWQLLVGCCKEKKIISIMQSSYFILLKVLINWLIRIILPVKTILLRILVNVVVWAQFEFKVTFVIGSDLDGDLNFLFRFISFYNYSIGILSRNFMGFRSHPRITANTTFASMTLLVLEKITISFSNSWYKFWEFYYCSSTTKSLVIIVIGRVWKTFSPAGSSWGWGS